MARNSSTLLMILAVAVVMLGVGLAAFALSGPDKKAEQATESESSSSMNKNQAATAKTTGSTVIRFTNKGFDKTAYTSKVGEAVTVKNESSTDLEFASDDHPTHREHPEMNMDRLAPGESGTVTPAGAGTYMFHDHINDEYTGTLVVE